MEISFHASVRIVFWMLGIIAFMRGVSLFEEEARAELEKKRGKELINRDRANFM